MTLTISPLYILFGIEALLIIIIFAVLMTIGRMKYKRLYNKLLQSHSISNIAKDHDFKGQDEGNDITKPKPPEKKDDDIASEQKKEDKPQTEKQDTLQRDEEETTSEQGSQLESNEDAFSFGPIKNEGVQHLKNVIDFQKEKIINLMCYKDILESAQKKLTSIHSDYKELEERFTAIQSDIGENKEYEMALEMFGENTKELKEFIDVLQEENETLLNKFNTWEGQLKDMWSESDKIVAEGSSADIEVLMAEKQEMMEKIKEFEEKIKEKTKQLEEAQAQYEDLENEYMTLYRQQQASQGK